MMVRAKQVSIPTTVKEGEVLLGSDGKIVYSGSIGTGIIIPAGTIAQRPVDPVAGTVRFNTELGLLEIFEGTVWIQVGKSSKISSEDGATYVDTQEEDGSVVIALDAFNTVVFENIDESTVGLTLRGLAPVVDLILKPKTTGQVKLPDEYVVTDIKSVATKGYVDDAKLPATGMVGQVLKQLTADTYGWADSIENSKGYTLYVDTRSGSDTNTGSFDRPFKTITAALDAATVASTRIIVSGGSYTENLVIDIPVVIEGAGAYDSALVTITGNHLLTTDATRFSLSNVKLDVAADTANLFTFQNSNGRVVFDNVDIEHTSATFSAITFEGDTSGWFMFKDCPIEGKVSIESESVTSFTVYFVEGFGKTDIVQSDSNAAVFVTNRSLLGDVDHGAGVMLVNNVNRITALNSSADTGFLEISKSSFYNAESGTYGPAVKTGSVDYIFAYSVRDPAAIWAGTQRILADTDNVKTELLPVNYLAVSKSVTSHFSGIDDAIGKAKTAGIAHNATGVVALTNRVTVVLVGGIDTDVILPATESLADGTMVHIKDVAGITTRPMTITPADGNTIEGKLTEVIEFAYESVTLVSFGSNWSIV